MDFPLVNPSVPSDVNTSKPTKESLVVFTSTNESRMTKTLTWTGDGWAKGKADLTTYFYAETAHFDGLWGLCQLLKKLECEPTKYLIRGGLCRDVGKKEAITRRHHDKHPDDETALIIDVERCTVPVDFDDVPMGDDYDLDDVEGMCIKAVKRYLPEAFQNVDFVSQLSSGAGTKEGGVLSVHLFFFSDRPVGTVWLRKFMQAHAENSDTAIYKQGQPLYTAAPLIFGGEDPIKQRCVYVNRDKKLLTLPEMDIDAIEKVAAKRGVGLVDKAQGYEAKMALLGDGQGLCGFHKVLAPAASSYVKNRLASAIDVEALIDDFIERVLACPNNGTARRLSEIKNTYTNREYLKKNITSGMDSFCLKPSKPRYTALNQGVEAIRGEFEPLMREKLLSGVKRASEGYMVEGETDKPHVSMMQVGTGIGKTHTALAACVELKAAAKAERKRLTALIKPLAKKRGKREVNDVLDVVETKLRDARMLVGRVGRVTFSVPTQKLADEVAARARAYGLTAETWRGRTQPDMNWQGNENSPKAFMCHRSDILDELLELGISAGSLCSSNPNVKCPHFDECAYQQQFIDCHSADVVVVPHASLAHEMPPINTRDTLIIDESFWQTMLGGPNSITTEMFKRWVEEADEDDRISWELLRDWFIGLEDGHVSHADLLKIIQTAETLYLELDNNADTQPDYVPGTPIVKSGFWATWDVGRIRAALLKGGFDRDVHKKRHLFKQIMAGFWAKGSHTTWLRKDGEKLVVTWVNPIRKGWQGKNTILIDASLDAEINKHFFEGHHVDVIKPLFATAPHATVTQVVDKPFGIRHFIDADGNPDADAVHEAWALVRLISLMGPTLAVCQQALEDELNRLGVGPGVDMAHFNAIRGIDRWKDVDAAVSIGRVSPTPLAVEDQTEHLTGERVTHASPADEFSWYASTNTGILLADGSGYPVKVDVHPDPMAERVRRQIVDEEVGQALERGRAVNRKADSPVHYFLFTNVPTRLAVDNVIHWDDICPSRFERMIASGVELTNATDMATGFPHLWENTKAVKNWRIRAKKQTRYSSPIIDITIENEYLVSKNPEQTQISSARYGFLTGTYKVDRKYAKTCAFSYHPKLCDNPEQWLTDTLGPLKAFEVERPPMAVEFEDGDTAPDFFEFLDAYDTQDENDNGPCFFVMLDVYEMNTTPNCEGLRL